MPGAAWWASKTRPTLRGLREWWASKTRPTLRGLRELSRPTRDGFGVGTRKHRGRVMTTATSTIEELANREYQHGFVTDIEAETVPRGLNEDIIRLISAKKGEPDWLLEWRLKAYRHWLTMEEPHWWPNAPLSRPSTTRTSSTTRPPSRRRRSTASMRSIRSCAAPSRSSASRWTSRSA